MDIRRQNTYLVCAIAAGLLSLPLYKGIALQGIFFVWLPMWLVMAVAMAASGLQLLSRWEAFSVPRGLEWALASLAGIGMGLAMISGWNESYTGENLAQILGGICAWTPLICLWKSQPMSRFETTPLPTASDSSSSTPSV